jgi:hypothetical protein
MEVRTLGAKSVFCKGTMGAKPRLYATSCGQNHVEQSVIAFECHQIRKWRHESSEEDRQQACRALFRAALNEDFMPDLRTATNGGRALGNARFKHQIAKARGRRVVPLPKGRPRKVTAARRRLSLL